VEPSDVESGAPTDVESGVPHLLKGLSDGEQVFVTPPE
jgi:hypothetical protein